jgi:hypothetical protein
VLLPALYIVDLLPTLKVASKLEDFLKGEDPLFV